MSKKQLQVSALVNELEWASSFFASRPSAADHLPSGLTPSPESLEPPSPIAPDTAIPTQSKNIPVGKVAEPSKKRLNVRTNESTIPQPIQPTKIRTNDRTDKQTTERTDDRHPRRISIRSREKVRHSFDIFADQLISLRELAIEQEKMFGERVLIGDLVQQAIDMLISKERNQ